MVLDEVKGVGCVYAAYRSGLSMQPWGEALLTVREKERWEPSFTDCGLLEKKSYYPGTSGYGDGGQVQF